MEQQMSIQDDIEELEKALEASPLTHPGVAAVEKAVLRRALDALKESQQPWQVRKANLDSHDDGHGPVRFLSEKTYWTEFRGWSHSNLGQGYSLACSDGDILDVTTFYAHRGFASNMKRAEDAEAKLSKAIELLNQVGQDLDMPLVMRGRIASFLKDCEP
jgi:hypothetical protein